MYSGALISTLVNVQMFEIISKHFCRFAHKIETLRLHMLTCTLFWTDLTKIYLIYTYMLH